MANFARVNPEPHINRRPELFITVPLLDELEAITALLESLKAQTYPDFRVIFCVNQPDAWWNDPDKKTACENNLATIALLKDETELRLEIIDKASPGKGWKGKHFGVGWARKTAMDVAAGLAFSNDIIVTMDGDTRYPADYLEAISEAFVENDELKAVSAPYFHRLTGRMAEDLAVLRYEIYMRYFALNMLRIHNPYAFTAIGSAMACPAEAYRGIRGITPHKSGEDFYFIQKLRKYGPVRIWLDETAFPAARFSDRVFFGTGPAMIRGDAGDWSGYPVFPFSYFDEVKETFESFSILYKQNIELPMSEFLIEKFGSEIWYELRKNAKSVEKFQKACIHKVDGLRILQFLKWRHDATSTTDEQNLTAFLNRFFPEEPATIDLNKKGVNFETATVEQLDPLRNLLFEKEMQWRKQINILRG